MGCHHVRRRRMVAAAGLVLALVGVLAVARHPFFDGAGEPGPPPITTVPATREPRLGSTCAGGGGVAIGTGDDAQRVVNAHRAGTTYRIRAGTYQRNVSVCGLCPLRISSSIV